jgi:hypothetical protein
MVLMATSCTFAIPFLLKKPVLLTAKNENPSPDFPADITDGRIIEARDAPSCTPGAMKIECRGYRHHSRFLITGV